MGDFAKLSQRIQDIINSPMPINTMGAIQWQEDAYWTLQGERDKRHYHKGNVEVTYSFTKPDKRGRDVFNYEKAVSDFLVKNKILADDTQIQKGTVQWCNGFPGVLVVIKDIPDEDDLGKYLTV